MMPSPDTQPHLSKSAGHHPQNNLLRYAMRSADCSGGSRSVFMILMLESVVLKYSATSAAAAFAESHLLRSILSCS